MDVFVVVLTLYLPIGAERDRESEITIPLEFYSFEECLERRHDVAHEFSAELDRRGWGAAQIIDAVCRFDGAYL